jgi:hypothetical protein
MQYLVILLKRQAFLPWIGRDCATIDKRTPYCRAIEIIFADHIRRADADLSRGQHSVPNQANNSHPADA